jgi:hypothetical protein
VWLLLGVAASLLAGIVALRDSLLAVLQDLAG